MCIKINFNDIEAFFKNAKCKLLSSSYKSKNSKLEYICSCGNKWATTWSQFKKGTRCRICSNKKISHGNSKRSYNYDFVKFYFEKQNCELIDKFDKLKSRKKVKFKCKCGKITDMLFYNFRKANHCYFCGKKQRAYSEQYVKEYFKKHKCELIDDYKDANTPMQYRCSCGQTSKVKFSWFLKGNRCRKCASIKNGHDRRKSLDEVIDVFEIKKCKLLTIDYKSCNQKLKYICQCNRIGHKSLIDFIKTHRCRECIKELKSGSNHYAWKPDRKQLKLDKKFSTSVRDMLRNCLPLTKTEKSDKTEIMLGYTIDEFQQKIMTHPNWHEVKNQKWSIDHIFPIAAFIKHNVLDVKLINCLDNLCPVTAKFNSSKGDRYNEEEFKEWLLTKGIDLEKE